MTLVLLPWLWTWGGTTGQQEQDGGASGDDYYPFDWEDYWWERERYLRNIDNAYKRQKALENLNAQDMIKGPVPAWRDPDADLPEPVLKPRKKRT